MPEWILTDNLTVEHLRRYPVWEYVNGETVAPETAVRPVPESPVRNLAGRLVGTRVEFHGGSLHWAILSNISLSNARSTKHFLCVSIDKNNRWFHLARYHDADYECRSPAELAKFIGAPVSDIFPIKYDISRVAAGDRVVFKGLVPEQPSERLTQEQLVALALEE